MDKFKAIRTFVAIADRGSLTAASVVLDVSLPTVVRTLAELERHLQVSLFKRTTRRINLTEEGLRYLHTCRLALAQLTDAETALTATQSKPSGTLTVTSSVLFGRTHVAPLVAAFLQRYPGVSAELVLLDRVVDLVEEGMDVGVRIGPLPDSSLHGLNVGQVRRVVCASPAYLRGSPELDHLDQLANHALVHFSGLGSTKAMQFSVAGLRKDVEIAPRWSSNSVDAALDAAVGGVGIGQFLSYMVEPLVKAGKLRVLLQAFEPPAVPVTLVYPHSRLLSTKVRLFVDQSAPALRVSLEAIAASPKLALNRPQNKPRKQKSPLSIK
jgi:DNA-binding transcriptional LysR family regulator